MADESTQENPTAADLIADLDLITGLAQRVVLQRNELREALTRLVQRCDAAPDTDAFRIAAVAHARVVLDRCKQ